MMRDGIFTASVVDNSSKLWNGIVFVKDGTDGPFNLNNLMLV